MFKIVLKSIWQKKLSIIFIFIQICIICYFIIDILTNFNVFLKQERDIHNVLGDVEEKLVKIEFQDLCPTKEFSSKVYELDNYLKEIDSIKFSGGFFTTTYIFDQLEKNEKYIEMNKKIIGSKKPAQVTDCLLLDDNMDNLMNISIKSGRNLNKGDFNINSGETIPILIGSNLNNILDVGDELDADDMMSYTGRTKFIVVDVMESDSYSIGRENLIANKLIDLNNYIVMPVYNELK